jgi:hypothetical protein
LAPAPPPNTPAPPPNNAVLDEVEVNGVTTDAATDNEDSPLMYQETKAMGDADHEVLVLIFISDIRLIVSAGGQTMQK